MFVEISASKKVLQTLVDGMTRSQEVYFDSLGGLMNRVAVTMEWFASKPAEVIPLFGKYEIA